MHIWIYPSLQDQLGQAAGWLADAEIGQKNGAQVPFFLADKANLYKNTAKYTLTTWHIHDILSLAFP